MTDDILPEAESPCVKICVVDPETDLCIGCGRTRDEIADWLNMNTDMRRDVLARLPERLSTLTSRRRRKGGARARRGARSDDARS